jgi:hypothetical protein
LSICDNTITISKRACKNVRLEDKSTQPRRAALALHLRSSPHVRDEHSLGIERLVVEAIAAVAVTARADFVEEGAVHSVLRNESRLSQQRDTSAALQAADWSEMAHGTHLLCSEDCSKTIGHGKSNALLSSGCRQRSVADCMIWFYCASVKRLVDALLRPTNTHRRLLSTVARGGGGGGGGGEATSCAISRRRPKDPLNHITTHTLPPSGSKLAAQGVLCVTAPPTFSCAAPRLCVDQ